MLQNVNLTEQYEVIATREQILEHLVSTLNRMENNYQLSSKLVGIVPILNGAWFFASDVMILLPSNCVLEPVKFSLYGDSRYIDKSKLQNIDECFILKPDLNKLEQCDIVLIVDDIVDSGYTIKIVKDYIQGNIKDDIPILSLVLVNVVNSEIKVYEPDYYLFEGNSEDWYFGYGMDYKSGLYRNLPFLARVAR